MDLTTLLNDIQRQAVEYNAGPAVIVAGAGSGKTRVLTYKIAYLMEQGVMPNQILALTFTNKAAREMKERIANVVDPRMVRYLWMGTFHSIFLRILRYEVENIGYQPNFTIYDTADSKSLIKSIVKEMLLDEKVYTANVVQSRISMLKNHLITPSVYASSGENISNDRQAKMGDFAQVYQMYCTRCKESNSMDFDDILLYTHFLFSQRADILEKYQDRFQYILVDEYQDTNTVQHGIVTRLASKHKRVSVVGDDAQSIYSFRGAKIDNMLQFNESFENCKLFKLEQNYRSTQTIVNAANSLIEKNINQIKKTIFSEKGVGELIDVVQAYSDHDEAARVSKKIEKSIERRLYDYQDIAILYRTNAQSRVLEEALRKLSIPYKIYGGLSFYQRKEIKDILAYLRYTINPNDVEAVKRIINYPARGIGETTKGKLFDHYRSTSLSIEEILNGPIESGLSVNKGTATKLVNFASLVSEIKEVCSTSDAYTSVDFALTKSGIMNDVSSTGDPDNISRKENLQEFLKAANEFCVKRVEEGDDNISLYDFLSEVSLLTDMDNEEEEKLNSVSLMTVHASKGLEFSMVYVVGLEENLFPSQRVHTMRDLEEERRLFYVAITRAKEICSISYAESRFMHGQMQFSKPSRFIDDIDQRYLNLPQMKSSSFGGGMTTRTQVVDPFGTSSAEKKTEEKRDVFGSGSSMFTSGRSLKKVSPITSSKPLPKDKMLVPGNKVVHTIFGEGEVLELEGAGENTKATIEFENQGKKQLLLKYARLTVVG